MKKSLVNILAIVFTLSFIGHALAGEKGKSGDKGKSDKPKAFP